MAADSWSAPRRCEHCPPTHRGGGVCVCVVVSASVALLTTLTPANFQPLPHIHAPEYARHTPDTAAASHFMPSWPPQGSVKQGLSAGWRLRSGANTSHHHTHQHTGVVVGVCVCVWWSQPLWLSSPHSLPPTPNHSLTFTRPNTHATRQPPPLHPISCRHGHHRAVSNKGCRQGGGSEAVRTLPTTTLTNTQGWWWVCVCVYGGLSLSGSPHHTHSRQLPTTPSHSRARIRTPHACHHRCIPFHDVMATTGQYQTRAGHAGRPHGRGRVAEGWRQTAGWLRSGANTAHQHTGVVVCVCVYGGLSLCGSPHHTHSRQLPTTPSHSRARIRTPHARHHRCIPFHADMATIEQCQTRAGHAGRSHGRPHGGGRVAAGWRQRGGRQLVGSEAVRTLPTNTQGWWWCVCVWWSQPLWLSSPHSLPPTPNHSLTFTRPNTHATRQPTPLHPISCRHGHHREVSNKGWPCWPTT